MSNSEYIQLLKKNPKINLSENQVTDEALFQQRRRFIKASMALSTAAYFPHLAWASLTSLQEKYASLPQTYIVSEADPHSYEDITSYNNCYELGARLKMTQNAMLMH